MILGFIHDKLPEGAYRVRYEAEFYRLKERKRVAYAANIELRIGLRYLIFSVYAKRWYERVIDETTDPADIEYYTKRKILWIYPTDENKEEIREDTRKHKLGYYKMMRKRQTELNHERHLIYANRQDAYQTKDKLYRKLRYGE